MAFTKDQKEQLRIMEKSGYLRELREMVRQYCAPFYWYVVKSDGQQAIQRNGTVSFVDTGVQVLMITCAHVVRQWKKDIEANPQLTGQIGGSTFDSSYEPIDIDDDLDLATFGVSRVFVNHVGGNIHSPRQWPPSPVTESEVVTFGGFPGTLRKEHDGSTTFLFPNFTRKLDRAGNSKLTVKLEIEEAYSAQDKNMPKDLNLGGCSGGPVFRIRDNLLVELDLIGIIYEYHDTFELVLARNTNCILSNGNINRNILE